MQTNLINGALLAGAIATSVILTGAISARRFGATMIPAESDTRSIVRDVNGVAFAVKPYSRIVSASTVADQVLIRVVEPSKLLAVSSHTLDNGDEPWRYEGKIGVGHASDIEAIIELRPDLVFVNNFVDVRHLERMKEAGLNVFDLGPMKGLGTLLPNIVRVSSVVGVPERGKALAGKLSRQLQSIAADIPQSARRSALYVGIHGDRLYGGTSGTSFHDVLEAGGLIDVAARAGYVDWPAYTNEQLLTLDPPWIITNEGRERAFCRHPGLDALAACRTERVRGVDSDLLVDPGLGIVGAAEAVRDAVYGPGPFSAESRSRNGR